METIRRGWIFCLFLLRICPSHMVTRCQMILQVKTKLKIISPTEPFTVFYITAGFLQDMVIRLTHLHFLLVVVDLPCDLDMHCAPLARFLKI